MPAMDVEPVADGPAVKRQKLTSVGQEPRRRTPGHSRLFAPYRTVGLVSPTAVPFTSTPRGKTTFQITTSVGRSLQTYDLRRGLNLVFITRPRTPGPILATTAWKDNIIASWQSETAVGVWIFQRGKKTAELELPRQWTESVKAFLVFGAWIVGVADTQLLVWKSGTLELYTVLQSLSPLPWTSCVASLPTFLNKFIIGRQDGGAEIWNVSSGKLIYTILPPSTTYGAVTAIQPTPALSLVAIAYESGPLLIHDIKTDQTVMQLGSASGTSITSISFRTDGMGAGDDGRSSGVMATTSSSSGDVTLWDLNNGGRKAGTLRAAHANPTSKTAGGISKVEFLPGQAILVTSGLDNSLKTWIFDETPFSPIPRILHHRGGHGGAVTKLDFLPSASDGSDDTGKWLLSASADRSLWGWSLRRDGQSTELSQGAVQSKAKKQGLLSGDNRDALQDLKCPPITSIATSLNRDGGIGALPGKQPIWQSSGKGKQTSAEVSGMTGWESVVTAHANDKRACTWFWGRKRAGRWAFETGDGGFVTSVAISSCGSFAIVGSDKGGIDTFNLQSGMHRQRFPARLTPNQAKQLKADMLHTGLPVEEETDSKQKKFFRGQGKHASPVIGLAVDSLNKTLMSAGADGKVKFWDFASGLLQHELDWSASTAITQMRFHQSSDLAAFACTDNCVRVVDTATHRLIRELWPTRTPMAEFNALKISDFAFSNDGTWIAAAMGPLVLIWDLPTGHLIDAFKLDSSCTSLAFSPNGEFLATATDSSVGVDVWSNRGLFTHVSTRHITPEDLLATLEGSSQGPTTSGESGENVLAATNAQSDDEDDIDALLSNKHDADLDQLSSDLLTLSLVPRARWQNLLHLDLIRQRNKPAEAPKKPEKAPFFLPSLQTNGQKQNAVAQPSDAETLAQQSRDLEQERSRVLKLNNGSLGQRSPFSLLLSDASSTNDYDRFVKYLQSLSPSAAEIEIRSLTPASLYGEDQENELCLFVDALIWVLQTRRAFELGQTWMAVFLRAHGDAVTADDEDDGLRAKIEEWRTAMKEERKRVLRLGGYAEGVVNWARAGRV